MTYVGTLIMGIAIGWLVASFFWSRLRRLEQYNRRLGTNQKEPRP